VTRSCSAFGLTWSNIYSDQIDKVITIGRHATGVVHPELVEIEHQNFLDFSSMETKLTQADICFYCLGVYQNQVAADVFWQITVGYLMVNIGLNGYKNRILSNREMRNLAQKLN
jgi:hypothetical protein